MRKLIEQKDRCSKDVFSKIISVSIIMIFGSVSANDGIRYISPGIRIGWAFGHGVSLGFKASMGVLHKGSIYNVTIGKKVALNRRTRSRYLSYVNCDLQYGHWLIPSSHVYSTALVGGGMGVGLGHTDSGGTIMRPHATVFGGNGLFGTADFLLISRSRTDIDFGVAGVLPIPLSFNFDARGKYFVTIIA
jgi:hypothetical protein